MTFPNGLCAFPITPADHAGRVDIAALRRLVARLSDAQVDSIGLLGSTGVYMYLTRDERRRAVEAALDEIGSRTPVVVGIGALRTDEAVGLAQDARAIGAAAGLLSAVSYTPLADEEVFVHFSTVARESGLPIVIYDNPGTTRFRFTPELVARLAAVPGIVAIKNPGWEPDETARHLAGQRGIVPAAFSIGCSGDWMATETMIAGADTWYSVLAGLFPEVCLGIVTAAQHGDAAEARRLDAALAPLWNLFRQFSSLRVVYALADLLDICHVEPPRPILPLPDAAKQQVAETLARLPAGITR
ncbi:4-hydroxy-tetrahydrodipicolinate synthase [Pseudochelatococcus lubricantis]|uniref:4-hydroxy-tetrahydrodipicolinate synthase n=1 Tax=Pseudochelatococcus lubricantis TaxID=1538102 RepID=A0ABX0UXI9_9HYPH|nr:dihydrodipicolinate synthase family protein [Pseudochelatococcus lubricantis]NIJ57662.1 4-hydroxy-tetrahydrodipicolinate synthase [Pseudochelatococcus lubricantis]